MSNEVQVLDRIAQAQVIVFPWENEVPNYNLSYDELSRSNPIDVSLELVNALSFDKNLGEAAGSFSFTLANTRDWKRVIRAGQWCLIYLSNDGDLNLPKNVNPQELVTPDLAALREQSGRLRAICYIDRVTAKGEVSEDGAFEVMYDVTGRDFGIVYEESTIWHNLFRYEKSLLDAANAALRFDNLQTVDRLVSVIHQMFFSPTDFPALSSKNPKDPNPNNHSVCEVGFQWLLPKELLSAIGASLRENKSSTFFGHIDGLLNFKPSKASYPLADPMSTLNGNAWDKLKTYSIQQLHELFPEISDSGLPQLTFRPIPWKLDGQFYPLIQDSIDSYASLADSGVQITIAELFGFDFGEDSHSRYNHFLTQVESGNYGATENIAELKNPSPSGRQFPFAQVSSIARHGFRPMHNTVNALIQIGLENGGKADQQVLVQYNEVMFDYWMNAVYFESGTARISGRNDVKLGKGFVFPDDAPYNAGKMFYIEGYSDEFVISENGANEWNQNVKLSRGAELTTIRAFKNPQGTDDNGDFSNRSNSFNETGEFTESN